MDCISSLPDSLLTHILSFLPMKDAVRTSLLSSRWRFLYASTPTLRFDDEPFYACNSRLDDDGVAVAQKSFVDFVDRVLLLRNGARIDGFRLNFCDTCDAGRVASWISAALRHHVCKLELCTSLWHPLPTLPCDLFSSKTLVVLKLRSLEDLKAPNLVCLPSLKVLHLTYVKFCGDGSGSRLISACPVLEELGMSYCLFESEHPVLTISISTLKRLSARWLHDVGLVLDTPNLDRLCINAVTQGCTWKNSIKSLAMAHIEISHNDSSSWQGKYSSLLSPISEIDHLRLSGRFMWDLEVDHFNLPASFKLTHLELISTAFGKSSVQIILNWLGYFSKIKVLTLTWDYKVSTENGFPDTSPSCLLSELLEVNILAFYGQASELSMLGYLLMNAQVLKKLTIKMRISLSEKKLHATNKLLSLPRLSQACVITFI